MLGERPGVLYLIFFLRFAFDLLRLCNTLPCWVATPGLLALIRLEFAAPPQSSEWDRRLGRLCQPPAEGTLALDHNNIFAEGLSGRLHIHIIHLGWGTVVMRAIA